MTFIRTNVFYKLKAQEKHLGSVPVCLTTKSAHCSKFIRRNKFTTSLDSGEGAILEVTISGAQSASHQQLALSHPTLRIKFPLKSQHTVAPTDLPQTRHPLRLPHPPLPPAFWRPPVTKRDPLLNVVPQHAAAAGPLAAVQ